jgi:hypothetical protein
MREVLVIITDFHVLGLFIGKKHDLGEKKIPLSRAVERKICATPIASPLKARKLKYLFSESLRPTLCPAYSEF